ncbi:MAG: DUF371 domain-containing protein [Candidatus Bathyarchaeia archaeon]
MTRVTEEIEAWGHPNITAKHKTTFELTKEESVTTRGDCILAVKASKAAAELSTEFKRLASRDSTRIIFLIEVNDIVEVAVGRGNVMLTFRDGVDIVARRSNYICDRTIMVKSNKAAKDFSRVMVEHLRDPDAEVHVTIIAES